MRRVGLLVAVLVLVGCASDGIEDTVAVDPSTGVPATPATTQPQVTSVGVDAPDVFSMRPVLGAFSVSPALSDPSGDHPASVDPETGITIVDDVTTEAYLLDPLFVDTVLWVGPAFLTGADIRSAAAASVAGPTGAGVSWVVVPEFTDAGRDKFRAATGELATHPVGSPQRRLAIVVDGVIVSAPELAAGVNPSEGLDPDQVIISILDTYNSKQEAEDLAALLRR